MRRLIALSCLLWIASCHAILGYEEVQFLPQADKVDVLLVVDNSVGTIMADKQAIFEIAVDALMEKLLGRVDDLHVGIVTSSLGSLGGDACDEGTQNDHGRLMARAPDGNAVSTYQEIGFLKWDPAGRYDPPGLSDAAEFRSKLRTMVLGTGQRGCAFEATLEAFYRFLVDPDPYASVQLEEQRAVLEGTDDQVLSQRAAFLRPDSLLLVVILTDENDCSLRAGGQYYQVAELFASGSEPFHLHPGRAACSIDPSHPCCTSCQLSPVEGCDASADEAVCAAPLDEMDDPPDLRCFQQRRRFGIDFLEPVDRYVQALTEGQVADRHGELRANPVFVGGRHLWHVVVAAIVGVPWQDIARRTASGAPDLLRGLDAAGHEVGGLQSAAELRANQTWDLVLGDPAAYFRDPEPRLPTDPLMRESVEQRTGVHPVTGEPINDSMVVNSISGHEHASYQELQRACIIRLPDPKDCNEVDPVDCACEDAPTDDVLCRDPDTGEYETTQHFASAYPGLRHLELLRALGDQAVLGSICPAQQVAPAAPAGYQPTVDALLEVIDPRLQ